MNLNSDIKDLLEKLQNLALEYNLKVAPRRQVQIKKPGDVFEVLSERRAVVSNVDAQGSSDLATNQNNIPSNIQKK